MKAFPKDFVWGAASSAYQIEGGVREGGRGMSIWDTFSHTPGCVARGETGDVACDSFHRWREDVALLASMHLGAYRFSVAWPRIAPDGEHWNAAGFEYYDALVDALLEEGIEPYLTLYHWDLPQVLEDRGGWQNTATACAFARFAEQMAEHFRGRVRRWFTINEPACIVGLGYGNGQHAPGLRLGLAGQLACWQNLLYAHCLATDALRRADAGNWVGVASTGRLCYPVSGRSEDVEAARRLTFACPDGDWTFTHQMLLDPVCLGHWPREEVGPQLAEALAKTSDEVQRALTLGRPDGIGLNIYNGVPARMEASGPAFAPRGAGWPRTAIGWPVEPASMDWGPRLVCARYGLPVYITENGTSCNDRIYLDGKVHDAERIDFTARYLLALASAMEHGADVRGYFHWSLLDNFEWHSGYSERFGLVFMDYATGRRIPKDSAAWYGRIAAENGAPLFEKSRG